MADEPNSTKTTKELETEDELLEKATQIVRQYDRVSVSLIQRCLEVSYARASRLFDQLEAKGVLAPSYDSSKPREVLKKKSDEPE